jgi:hypothetical protein
MDVVDRAIQRVYVPLLVAEARQLTTLLRYDAIAGVMLANMAEQELLRLSVGFAHQVDYAFMVHAQV